MKGLRCEVTRNQPHGTNAQRQSTATHHLEGMIEADRPARPIPSRWLTIILNLACSRLKNPVWMLSGDDKKFKLIKLACQMPDETFPNSGSPALFWTPQPSANQKVLLNWVLHFNHVSVRACLITRIPTCLFISPLSTMGPGPVLVV